MATLEEKRQFYANNPKEQTTISMSGKSLRLASFPSEIQKQVMNRLAEKDEVMAKGKAGILPGIKIDGKEVTRDNLKDFEKKPEKAEKKEVVTKESKKETKKEKLTKKELEAMTFSELRKLGYKVGTKDRSKKNIIKEILKLQ